MSDEPMKVDSNNFEREDSVKDEQAEAEEQALDDMLEDPPEDAILKAENPAHAVFLFFTQPTYNVGARITSTFIMVVIAVSILSFIIETLPQYKPLPGAESLPAFSILDTICTVVFLIEYLARLFTVAWVPSPFPVPKWRKVWNWIKSPLAIIDLLSILPYFLALALQDSPHKNSTNLLGVFKVARIARVLRIFKFAKYSRELVMFVEVLRLSVNALLILVFLVGMAFVVCGTLVYFCEQGTYNPADGYYYRYDVTGLDQEISPYSSIPQSMWWVAVTITTVGYGDLYPTSLAGKIIGIFTMLLGILVLALPISIIGNNFNSLYEEEKERKAKEKEEKRMREQMKEMNKQREMSKMASKNSKNMSKRNLGAPEPSVVSRSGFGSMGAAVELVPISVDPAPGREVVGDKPGTKRQPSSDSKPDLPKQPSGTSEEKPDVSKKSSGNSLNRPPSKNSLLVGGQGQGANLSIVPPQENEGVLGDRSATSMLFEALSSRHPGSPSGGGNSSIFQSGGGALFTPRTPGGGGEDGSRRKALELLLLKLLEIHHDVEDILGKKIAKQIDS